MTDRLSPEILDLKLPTTDGEKTVRDLLDPERPTVFMAYPMDFTPVCTAQMCHYRDNWDELAALPCRWWGLNQASMKKHESFREKKRLPFELVTDERGDLLKALHLWGILRTRRGFAVVSPEGEILGVSTIFPFFYQRRDQVLAFLRPLLPA